MTGNNQCSDTEWAEIRAATLASLAETLLSGILDGTKKRDKDTKRAALYVLALCTTRSLAVPPPVELVNLIEHLLGLGQIPRKTRTNPFSSDPVKDQFLRGRGRELGLSKPQPETVLKINDILIPYELSHTQDDSGNRPSAATDEQVSMHMGERTSQVRKWRKLAGVKRLVAQARIDGSCFHIGIMEKFMDSKKIWIHLINKSNT